MRRTIFLAALTLFSLACSEEDLPKLELTPIDVSFLIPLGRMEDLRAATVGGFGPLLPRDYFDRLEPLTRIDEPDVLYDRLDVVGVRLDPCFIEGLTAEKCESQIRLVLQPVIGDPTSVSARDAAVHAFYSVPINEIETLSQKLAALRVEEATVLEAGVHPMPERATELLLPSLGAQRLIRLAFVSVHASEQAWIFGGFNIVDGMLTELELIGMPEHKQHLTSVGGTEALDATILPPAVIEVEANHYMENIKRNEMTDTEVESAKRGLIRLLDPRVHDTGTVDCATCHMATASLYYANGDSHAQVPGVYANTQNQRMFGFFGRKESISPRVHIETSFVLEYFETKTIKTSTPPGI